MTPDEAPVANFTHCPRYNTRSAARIAQAARHGEGAEGKADTPEDAMAKCRPGKGGAQCNGVVSGVMTRNQKRKVETMEFAAPPPLVVAATGLRKRLKNAEMSSSADTHYAWSQASEAGSVLTSDHASSTPAANSVRHVPIYKSGSYARCATANTSSSNGSIVDFSFHVPESENALQSDAAVNTPRLDAGNGVSCQEELDDEEGEDDSISIVSEVHAKTTSKLAQSQYSTGFSYQNRTKSYSVGCIWSSTEREPNSSTGTDGVSSTTRPSHPSFEVCGVYEKDIYDNLKILETKFKSPWGYLEAHQPFLGANHRRLMVNWLVEFAEVFDLHVETLFLGVALLDAFLIDGPQVERSTLQLLGMASMLIAIKFEESKPSNLLCDCCEVAEETFTQAQVVTMEAMVLKTLNFRCAIPTASTFIWRYLKAAGADCRMEKLAEYLISLTLLEYNFLKFKPSLVSASAVLLAGHTLGKEPWNVTLQEWTGYTPFELREAVEGMHAIHKRMCENHEAGGRLLAIKLKFQKSENLHVANTIPCVVLPDCLYKDEQR